jgi:hypothetical protein
MGLASALLIQMALVLESVSASEWGLAWVWVYPLA